MMTKTLKGAILIVLAAAMLFMVGCGAKNEQPAKDAAGSITDSVTEERQADLEAVPQNPVEEEVVNVSNEALLKELASLETGWTADLHKIIVTSDQLTDKWLYGEASYNQYIVEFHKCKLEFDELYKRAEAVYKEKDFANKLKDEPQYNKKLIQGQQLRDNVKDFFDIVYGGKKDESGKLYDVSGEKYKELYNDKMVKQYNNYYRTLKQL